MFPQVQLHLFSVFATDLVTGLGCAAHIRREVGVRRLMYMLKEHYWFDKPANEIDPRKNNFDNNNV